MEENEELDERALHRIRYVKQETNPLLEGMVTQYEEIDVSGQTHKDAEDKFRFVLENRKKFHKRK